MSALETTSDLERIGVCEILDTLADGAYVTDVNRKILFWSRAAARITGWDPHEVAGRSCSDNLLIHVDQDGHSLCGQDQCPLHRAIVAGQPSRNALLVYAQHRNGHRVPVEVSVSPIRNAQHEVIGGIEVFRDLTLTMDDLRRARAIQDHTLQCPLPTDPRFRFEVRFTAEEVVSGDFYRIEALDADHYAILVADVMGHGVSSALYTMQLRALWEDFRGLLGSPGEFMAGINQRLHRLISANGYFATGVCLLIDARTGSVRYVRAGHPAPLLFRRTGEVTALSVKSPALGFFREAKFQEGVEQLAAGDTMLLYTDAAIEVTNPAGEVLGHEGWLQLLVDAGFGSGVDRLDEIENRLFRYCRGVRLPDDLTLLSIRREA